MKRINFFFLMILVSIPNVFAKKHWHTHFSYNSVQLIAMDSTEVYALANGKLFSINQQTESLTLFNNFSGLHGTEIVHIAYDESHKQLLILYADGKMDIRCNGKTKYVSDLYNKQMTSSKICNNVTFHEDIAYLSMDFGILTFDLIEHKFVDAYYIGPEAQDIRITDVMLYGDSIYAQTATKNYSAHVRDNIVDFRYWAECVKLPQEFDLKKGKQYTNKQGDIWEAAGEKGVYRKSITNEQTYYLPDGPCVNTPYHIEVFQNKLYMVPGGRWASQENKPGNIMIYEDNKWTNITNRDIEQQTKKKALDFMDIAVDPQDPTHFFVSSYGTGLYEFKDTRLIAHHTHNNSIIGSAAANNPDHYTRIESIVYDSENRLWSCVNGEVDTTLVCFLPNGQQRGLNLYTDSVSRFIVHTFGGLVIDALHPQKKWLVSCRSIPAVIQLDDGGTPFNIQDDQSNIQSEFYDQDGNVILPEFFYTLAQAPNGDIWVGSSSGPIVFSHSTDFLKTNECRRLRITMPDGFNCMETERINAFAWDNQNNIWIGTHSAGIYVLNEDATEILEHFTSDNSVMPSNSVLTLAYDNKKQQMFIGTGMGLVSYKQDYNTNTNTDFTDEDISYGSMYQWRSHAAFTKVEQVVVMGNKAYGLSSHSLFSVTKDDRKIEYYTRQNGLNSSVIDHIAYNESLDRMLITYQNGQIDIMTSDGNIHNIPDLYLKQMNVSKRVNDICMHGNQAILAMEFGILVVNMKKAECVETYYIGENSTEIPIQYITVKNDTIYAATYEEIYFANMTDNLMDYSYWQKLVFPNGKIGGMRTYTNNLYLLIDQNIYFKEKDTWSPISSIEPQLFRGLCATKNGLYALPYQRHGIWKIDSENHSADWFFTYGYNYAIQEDGNVFWLGSDQYGLIRLKHISAPQYQSNIEKNYPEGPLNNYAYRLKFLGNRLYMLPGGRWASEYKRPGDIMIYENGQWTNIKNNNLVKQSPNQQKLLDFMNVAQDPKNDSHYFITTYGTGVLEMKDGKLVNVHLPSNSPLLSAASNNPNFYTRTDGAIYDEQGNLWILNAGDIKNNIHIIEPNGKWKSFKLAANGKDITLNTPGEILIDNRNSQWKWIPSLRADAGLILLQDNGTPTNPNDDHITFRHTWIDQSGKTIATKEIRSIAQDLNHTIWIGTSSGIFAIPSSVDFATSNKCIRIIIPRNDGSGLGDYLLDSEQINAIAIDGANRLWVGTTSSGVFLLNPIGDISNVAYYTVETIAHFTTENSILPTNEIVSIAIQESTGEVFIGTSGGLVSYKSDAIKPFDNYDNLYAYPNPVQPTYQGVITIAGLIGDSEIRIVDASGNLVQLVQGQGGAAVWDGKNAQGNRVATGVYTAICNTKTGTAHGSVKILILN